MYEVEQKYRVPSFTAIEAALAALGATVQPTVTQVDTYYAHPLRNFAESDEALRTRLVGDQMSVTYKGPKLAHETKTRREIELPLGAGLDVAQQFGELLRTLDFSPVREVKKRRQRLVILWQGENVEAALDTVEQLGEFVELELIVDEAGLQAAQQTIADLAQYLGLRQPERRSYLELLLDGG